MQRLLFALLCALPLFLAACSGSERYGAALDPNAPAVTVKDIFLRADLEGASVTLEGKVYTQCQSSGCWFVLDDGTGQIYVDLSQGNMTLPARVGRAAKTSGTVATAEGGRLFIAKGIELR